MIEKLYPVCKDYLWGGQKLKNKYNKQTNTEICAESWELSFHNDGPTCLKDGRALRDTVTPDDLGEKAKQFPFFPMLIKWIDARDNLSVQVHPSDDYALQYENSFGKTEAWYIVEAEKGAGIYLGFNRDVTKEEVEKAIVENTILSLLNFYEVKAGECYFIPSGTLHAIGKGCLICEVQQNSNLTYRVYDYDRRDKNGNPRELHVEKALKVMNFEQYTPISFDGNVVAKCSYFTLEAHRVKGEYMLPMDAESFRCVIAVSGNGTINGQAITAGESYFISANKKDVCITGNLKILIAHL